MMLATETEEFIARWVYGILHEEPNPSGAFLRNIAEAAARADPANYAILRPALLLLAAKYPEYRCAHWEQS